MDLSTGAISARAIGAYPVSIATSLCLESIAVGPLPAYDPDRVVPAMIDISQYDVVYVNAATLFRNILGALPSGGDKSVVAGDIYMALAFEIELINKLIVEISFGKTKVVFYTSQYAGLDKKHPHAKFRVDTTEKQMVYTAILQNTISYYIKQQAKENTIEIVDVLVKPASKVKGLIITHYAYDLLAAKHFNSLDLLETHTGVLKTKSMWYTKLTGGKDLMRIPFGSMALQVFGDSQTFYGQPAKVKEQVIELADKYKWTNTTTKDRLSMCFDFMSDKFTATILKKMLSE